MKKSRSHAINDLPHAPKLFQPIPRPKKPTLPTVTVWPGSTWGMKEISKPLSVVDHARLGDFIQAQAQYFKDYREWRVKERARQEVLDEFVNECMARGPAGLVAFAQAAGNLETARKFPWFENKMRRLEDFQEYGTPREQKEAKEALKVLREIAQRSFSVKRGSPRKRTLEEATERTAQKSRERKQHYDQKEQKAREKLTQAIRRARVGLPRTVTRDPQRREKALRDIVDKTLAPYLNSEKAYERKAARTVKGQMDRQLSPAKM